MSIFYHVSTNLNHDGQFEPRIPSSRHKQSEDSETPRVSVAPMIANCLTALPGGGSFLDELNIELRGYYLVFRIDTEKLGISEDHIIDADTLYKNDWVRDADATDEYWIICSFKVPDEDTFAIKLVDWNESPEDIVPYSLHDIADKHYEGDLSRAYFNIYGDYLPSTTIIEDIDYIDENVEAGKEVRIYIVDEDEREGVLSHIQSNHKVNIIENSIDEIKFSLEEQKNLRSLFIQHQRLCMIHY